jgi:hypothetical protein
MDSILAWLQAAPTGAITLATAILTALVAIFVTVLTQWVLGRRARTDLLTKKLEELYLALNEASAHNVERFHAAVPLTSPNPFDKVKVSTSSVNAMGLDLHKKIIMYVRLYFPKLSAAHQAVFAANQEVNNLIYEAETGPPIPEERLLLASGHYGDTLQAMEAEIISNRSCLVRETILPRRYKTAEPNHSLQGRCAIKPRSAPELKR